MNNETTNKMKSKADILKLVTEWEEVKIYQEIEALNEKIERLNLSLIVKAYSKKYH